MRQYTENNIFTVTETNASKLSVENGAINKNTFEKH